MSAHERSRVMGLVLLSETAHPFTPQGHCQGMMKPVLTSSVPLKDDKLPPFEARLLGSASRLLATHWGLDGERPSPSTGRGGPSDPEKSRRVPTVGRGALLSRPLSRRTRSPLPAGPARFNRGLRMHVLGSTQLNHVDLKTNTRESISGHVTSV